MISEGKALDASFFTEMQKVYFWSLVERGSVDACWPWLGGRSKRGYGKIQTNGRSLRAPRVVFVLSHGPLLDGEITRHSCDNPPCCNPKHILKGTNLDNSRDMVERERQAKGERHGSVTHPERVPRGDRNGRRKRPEKWTNIPEGEAHWTHRLNRLPGTTVEGIRVAARGDANGARLHPEKVIKGEDHHKAKLTWEKVRLLRKLRVDDHLTYVALGQMFGVTEANARFICLRKTWKDDPQDIS